MPAAIELCALLGLKAADGFWLNMIPTYATEAKFVLIDFVTWVRTSPLDDMWSRSYCNTGFYTIKLNQILIDLVTEIIIRMK